MICLKIFWKFSDKAFNYFSILHYLYYWIRILKTKYWMKSLTAWHKKRWYRNNNDNWKNSHSCNYTPFVAHFQANIQWFELLQFYMIYNVVLCSKFQTVITLLHYLYTYFVFMYQFCISIKIYGSCCFYYTICTGYDAANIIFHYWHVK